MAIVVVPEAIADEIVCEREAETGATAGECSGPNEVAVDRKEGLLYVADSGSRRVNVFKADASLAFLLAFGWDVAPDGAPGDTAGDGLEVCSSACQAGSTGAGAGQFGSLVGITVDNDEASPSFGDVYVFDGANNRVQRFRSSGEFVLMFGDGVNQTTGGDVCTAASGDLCQAGISGSGAGQFKITPQLFVGPAGIVYVGDTEVVGFEEGDEVTKNRVQTFDSNGAHLAECFVATAEPGRPGRGLARGIAVDSSGNIYFASGSGTGGVRKVDSACNLVKTLHPNFPNVSFSIQAIAIGADDHLFVADNTETATSVYEYDPAGTLLKVFYGDGLLQSSPISLAPYQSATGDIFAAEEPSSALDRVLHVAFPPAGPVVHPQLTEAKSIGNTKATLNARINPEGEPSTYRFEYVDDATYQNDIDLSGDGFDHAQTSTEAEVLPPENSFVEPLFALGRASAEVGCPEPENPPQPSCLIPETVYHFRVVTKNADSLPGERIGPEVSFETGQPFEILATWSSKVGADAALLRAEVNALNIPATGHFEYVEEAAYQKDIEAGGDGFKEASASAPIDFGSDEVPVVRSLQLHALKPDTSYRYRITVENSLEFGPEAGEARLLRTFPLPVGPDHCPSNEDFRSGASAGLPDCRAYEMVSPVDKEGGELPESKAIGKQAQSAAEVPSEGRGFTYSSTRAFGDAISAPYTSQYMASRYPPGHPEEGWVSRAISPPREGAAFDGMQFLQNQYKAFSGDLRYGWLRNDSEPPLDLDPPAIPGYPNLYRRDDVTGAYEAICPVKPPPAVESSAYSLELQVFSAEQDLTVFRANAKLVNKASSKSGISQLYGCKGQELMVLSVLPPARGGKANPDHSSAGTRLSTGTQHFSDSVHNALAANGSRLYWTDADDQNVIGPGTLYLRKNPFAEGAECAGEGAPCTVEVSESVVDPGADEDADFWTASPDGSVAIFSFAAGPLAGNLYEFDAETETSELIADGAGLSGDGDEDGFFGIAGYSEDAQRLYFVSNEAIEGVPGAISGQPNIYFYEAGKGVRLVAAFQGGDGLNGYCFIHKPAPDIRCTRATADGLRLAFMSGAKLSDYDNADAASGKPAVEVYLYDATANGGEGQLHCVSCNPSGARPTARAASGTRIAAQIPRWDTSFHAPRALSADGQRLFFESFDALVLADTNGAKDVYQWEEAGKGGCDVGDATYFARRGGCIDLISSGESPRDSSFVDASADGSDVFFDTASSLLPQDPGLVDVYDARVQGGFPAPDPPDPECEGETCPNPPAPPSAPSPSSSSFRGPSSKPGCRKGKRKIRKAGKVRCVRKRRSASAKRKGTRAKGTRAKHRGGARR